MLPSLEQQARIACLPLETARAQRACHADLIVLLSMTVLCHMAPRQLVANHLVLGSTAV
jgi:hypothetical protein